MHQVTPMAPAPAQRRRLEVCTATESVDVHCHCLPGLDDGPATLAEALELCRVLVADGVTTAIATPHQLGRFDGHVTASAIRQAVADLRLALDRQGIPLRVAPGADVRVDERIPALLDADAVLTLADSGKYLLLELPHEAFLNIAPLLAQLAARGITPVLSHPERNPLVAREPNSVLPWLEQGALLQVTAASLLGRFGPMAQHSAWHWLASSAASMVASDAHGAAERRPCMTEAIEAVAQRLGRPTAQRVCVFNPMRVLAGEPILPVRPALRRGEQRWATD